MISFDASEKWEGLEGMGQKELEKLRGPCAIAVDRAGLALENEVKRTLGPEGGARTGAIYVVPPSSAQGKTTRGGRRKPRKNPPRHQASAPGEPPAVLFGQLRQSIHHSEPVWDGWTVSTEVGTNQPQSRRLEWGGIDKRGIRILPRPYFAPSVLRAEQQIETILEGAVKG